MWCGWNRGAVRNRHRRCSARWRGRCGSGTTIAICCSDWLVPHRRTLDCDALEVPDCDQTVVVYSAAPGTPEAAALELLRVTGTEQFTR